MIATSKNSQLNATLVLKAIETIFDDHRVDAFDQFFDPNFVQHSAYVPPGGRRELAQWWQIIVEAIPDIRGTVEHVIATEDSVAVFRTLKGTIKKDLPAFRIKASNQVLEFRVAHLFQLKDGKIIGHWEVMDSGPATTLAYESR